MDLIFGGITAVFLVFTWLLLRLCDVLQRHHPGDRP
jgi:hypothetical protein